jgi:hypothetical protein
VLLVLLSRSNYLHIELEMMDFSRSSLGDTVLVHVGSCKISVDRASVSDVDLPIEFATAQFDPSNVARLLELVSNEASDSTGLIFMYGFSNTH